MIELVTKRCVTLLNFGKAFRGYGFYGKGLGPQGLIGDATWKEIDRFGI